MPNQRGTSARPIRALITDVDGTLTDAHRRLDPRAITALREVEGRGVPVVLATGNVLPIALAIHRSLGLSGPIVAENGGVDRRSGRWLDTVSGLRPRRIAGYRRLRAAGLPVRRLFTDRWRETEVALEADVPGAHPPRPSGPRPHRRSDRLRDPPDAAGGGKLPALEQALASPGDRRPGMLGRGMATTTCRMLRAAGTSVSFANGSPRARAAADWVARQDSGRASSKRLSDAGWSHDRASEPLCSSAVAQSAGGRRPSGARSAVGRTAGTAWTRTNGCARSASSSRSGRKGPPAAPLPPSRRAGGG